MLASLENLAAKHSEKFFELCGNLLIGAGIILRDESRLVLSIRTYSHRAIHPYTQIMKSSPRVVNRENAVRIGVNSVIFGKREQQLGGSAVITHSAAFQYEISALHDINVFDVFIARQLYRRT